MSLVSVSVNPPILSLRPASASRANPGAVDTDPSEPPVNRLLSHIAGFYRDERLAQSTADQIRHAHGLGSDQLLLLNPRGAPGKRLSRLAGLWSAPWPAGRQSLIGGRLALALLAGFVLLLASWMVLLWTQDPGFFSNAKTLAWLVGSLGLGLVTAWLLQRHYTRPHLRRFESQVQQQLALGHWALVVCQQTWVQQAGVLDLLRADSLRWCAVAEPSSKL